MSLRILALTLLATACSNARIGDACQEPLDCGLLLTCSKPAGAAEGTCTQGTSSPSTPGDTPDDPDPPQDSF